MLESQYIIKQIENDLLSICNECEGIIYYPPEEYRESSVRIINATMLLFNDAVRLIRDKAEYGIKTKLPISQIKEMMQKIYFIMQGTNIIVEKEKEIAQVFKDKKLNPQNFLILDEWNGRFVEHISI